MSIGMWNPKRFSQDNELPEATRNNTRAKENLLEAQRLSVTIVSLVQRANYVFNDIGIDIADLKRQLRID